jgi:hypothetical protein
MPEASSREHSMSGNQICTHGELPCPDGDEAHVLFGNQPEDDSAGHHSTSLRLPGQQRPVRLSARPDL